MFTEDKASGETPSLDGFIKFCDSKDPNEKYHWTNSHQCACGQYLKSIGQYTQNWVGSSDIMTQLNRIAGGNPNDIYYPIGYKEQDWTFGQCHDRAKQAKKVLEPTTFG